MALILPVKPILPETLMPPDSMSKPYSLVAKEAFVPVTVFCANNATPKALLEPKLPAGLLRGLTAHPEQTAETLGALIDGVYLRAVLTPGPTDPKAALTTITSYLEEVLA